VKAEIEQALGQVHGADAVFLFQRGSGGDEFVHAAVALRNGQDVLHTAEQIIGVEHGVLGDGFEAVGSVRANVAVSSHEDADVAKEAPHPADGKRAVGG